MDVFFFSIIQRFLKKLQDWHKALLLLIVGIPITLLSFIELFLFFAIPMDPFIDLLIIIGVFVGFGIAGGYIAKNAYLKTGFSFIILFFLMFVGLFLILFMTLPIDKAMIFMALMALSGLGIVISVFIFLLLFPSLLIGSKIEKMKNPEIESLSKIKTD